MYTCCINIRLYTLFSVISPVRVILRTPQLLSLLPRTLTSAKLYTFSCVNIIHTHTHTHKHTHTHTHTYRDPFPRKELEYIEKSTVRSLSSFDPLLSLAFRSPSVQSDRLRANRSYIYNIRVNFSLLYIRACAV